MAWKPSHTYKGQAVRFAGVNYEVGGTDPKRHMYKTEAGETIYASREDPGFQPYQESSPIALAARRARAEKEAEGEKEEWKPSYTMTTTPKEEPEPIRLGDPETQDENYRAFLRIHPEQDVPYDPNTRYIDTATVSSEGPHPGESEFQRERRESDEAARERELKNREEDKAYFERIAQEQRQREVSERAYDATFYAKIEEQKREDAREEKAREAGYYLKIARENEERKAKEREEDRLYYEEVARLNRERELREREEDNKWWEDLKKRREEEKKTTLGFISPGTQPTPAPTKPGKPKIPVDEPTPPGEEPGEKIPITDPKTGRVFHVPSSLLFGLLRTSGYYEEFLEEEEKKKNKK